MYINHTCSPAYLELIDKAGLTSDIAVLHNLSGTVYNDLDRVLRLLGHIKDRTSIMKTITFINANDKTKRFTNDIPDEPGDYLMQLTSAHILTNTQYEYTVIIYQGTVKYKVNHDSVLEFDNYSDLKKYCRELMSMGFSKKQIKIKLGLVNDTSDLRYIIPLSLVPNYGTILSSLRTLSSQ